jgi:hypothetical protein
VAHVLVLVHRRVVAAHGKALVVLPALVILPLSAARILSPGQKWAFAEKALQHAERMLDRR